MTQRRATLASLWVSGLPCYRLGYAPRTRSHLGVRGLSVVPSLLSGLADRFSADGELYSATLNNFLGTEPVILRNMGPHHPVKTEYLAFWLNGEPRGAGMGTGRALGEKATTRASLSLFPFP